MTNAALSLKALLVPSKETEIEYPGLNGFKVKVVFLSREVLNGLRKKALKISYKNRNPVEELDDKLFLQLYTNAAIKGWSGLKLEYLNTLAPVDLTGQDLESELGYSQDNALYLMQASVEFDSFISETVTDLANFTKTSTGT